MRKRGAEPLAGVVGGICLSLLFQSYESLRSIRGVIVYSSLILVAWPRGGTRVFASAAAPPGLYLLKPAFGIASGL